MDLTMIPSSMIYYLILAQLSRAAIIWTSNALARKMLRTLAVFAVMFYLIERAKRQNYIDAKRGYDDSESNRAVAKNDKFSTGAR